MLKQVKLKKINNDGSGGYTMLNTATTLYAQWNNNTCIILTDLRDTFGEIAHSFILIGKYCSSIGYQTDPKNNFI